MEVSLFEAVGLPEGSVLSVRAGSTRRQAPVPLAGPLRFPNLPFNAKQFKVDIMKTLGSAKIEIKAVKELESYSLNVDLGESQQARIGFTVREQPSLCGKRASELKQVDRQLEATSEQSAITSQTLLPPEKAWAATDTRTYARDHNIPNFVQEMLQNVLREKPDAPFSVMAEYLQKKAIELGEKPGPGGSTRAFNSDTAALAMGSSDPGHVMDEQTLRAPETMGTYTKRMGNTDQPQPLTPQRAYRDDGHSGAQPLPPRREMDQPQAAYYDDEDSKAAYYDDEDAGVKALPQHQPKDDEEGSMQQEAKAYPPDDAARSLPQQQETEQQHHRQQQQQQQQEQRRHQQQLLQQQQHQQQQPLKKQVHHQLPPDQKDEGDFGLRSTYTKHQLARLATIAMDDLEPDPGAEFYIPKTPINKHDSYEDDNYDDGEPDGYVPHPPDHLAIVAPEGSGYDDNVQPVKAVRGSAEASSGPNPRPPPAVVRGYNATGERNASGPDIPQKAVRGYGGPSPQKSVRGYSETEEGGPAPPRKAVRDYRGHGGREEAGPGAQQGLKAVGGSGGGGHPPRGPSHSALQTNTGHGSGGGGGHMEAAAPPRLPRGGEEADAERLQLEAEHMALHAERASLLHDLAKLSSQAHHA